MTGTQTVDLLDRVRRGILDEADTRWLEKVPADEFVAELESSRYPVTFQERRIGAKWEKSLARSVRAELVARRKPDALFISFVLVPAYIDCLTLSMEGNHVTGVSRLTRLTAWPVKKPEPGLALRSGRGFKCDLTPDGWSMKAIGKRTVRLSSEFLRKRGWRFDHLAQALSTP